MIFMLFQCKKYSKNKKICQPTDPKKYSDVSKNKTFIFLGLNTNENHNGSLKTMH